MYATLTMGIGLSTKHFLQLSYKQQNQSNSCIYKQLIVNVQTLGLISSYVTAKQLIFCPDDLFIRPFKLLIHTRSYKQRKVKAILVN